MDCREGQSLWKWVRYYGSNPHDHHMHVSVMSDPGLFDDGRPWDLPMFRGQPTPGPITPPVQPDGARLLLLTSPRMTGDDVRELQRVLAAWYPSLRLAVDGIFGPATDDAVRLLQRNAGISVDGKVGPVTRAVLHR